MIYAFERMVIVHPHALPGSSPPSADINLSTY